MVESDGVGLGNVARPQPGITWSVPSGQRIDLDWPDPCYVMMDLVRKRGRFDPSQYLEDIDIILECAFDDEQKRLKKRIKVQVDPVNYTAIQL